MKTFVIGYLDFFENDLKLEKVEAESAVSALVEYLGTGWNIPDGATVEDIQDIAFNGEICISIIEI